ncbi:Electron transport complex protein RnfE [Marinomonas spartinae]|uniref:Ion-translocating oxidoreductase complex subunit E n=1 Tax=Marinomonas spartinae TaxID=1792290 RepID=A0A1A8TRH4_9GAMM|nr:electron transport complex subunit E [Marinomonas spartinae]SBS36703.1 Electron transport complex protein RnfE [Marinomonas spartinae]
MSADEQILTSDATPNNKASANYTEIIYNGLWKNNPALVQLLGLCPMLAVTSTVVNALGLGLATTAVLMGSNMAVSLIRNYVADAVRLPAFVMIIASFTTCIQMIMQAYTYELYQILGIFIPLIVTNCVILGRADSFASRNPVLPSILDGMMMGLGFTSILIVLGGMRELIGQGTLFSDMQLLFGSSAAHWKIVVFHDYPNVLFALLPPGAFIGLGILIAMKNYLDESQKKRLAEQKPTQGSATSKRVRVTGQAAS